MSDLKDAQIMILKLQELMLEMAKQNQRTRHESVRNRAAINAMGAYLVDRDPEAEELLSKLVTENCKCTQRMP